jgi:capsular polysaccharide export protein
LVAGALILYPRCMDPVTGLPCPPEVLIERVTRPELFRARDPFRLRAAQGFWLRLLARLGLRP